MHYMITQTGHGNVYLAVACTRLHSAKSSIHSSLFLKYKPKNY